VLADVLDLPGGSAIDPRLIGFENAPSPLGVLSPQMDWLEANRSLRCLLGYTLEELRKLSWPAIFHPDSAEAEDVRLRHVLVSGERTVSEPASLRRKGGGVIRAAISLQVARDADAQPLACTVEVRLLEEEEQRGGRLENLLLRHELEMALLSAATLEEALEASLNAALRVSGLDCGGIYLLNDSTGSFDLAVHRGLSESFVRSAAHYRSDTPQARLVRAGTPLYTEYADVSVPGDPRAPEGLRTTAIVPVPFEGRSIACMNVASHSLLEVPGPARVALETIALRIGDTIARVKAAESARRERTNLQTLFRSARDFLVVLDLEGRIVAVNPEVLARLGYEESELLGQPVLMMHPPEDREEAANVVGEMAAGRRKWCHLELLTQSGDRIPVETSVAPGTWDGREVLFGISRDISERRRAEEALRGSEAVLKSFFESPGTMRGIVELLEDDILCVSANPAAAEFIGATVGSMRSHRVSELGMPPGAIRQLTAHFEQSRRTGSPVTFAHQHKSAKGVRWLAQVVSYLGTGTDGRPRFTFESRDITPYREAQEQLRRSEERYRGVVEDQTEVIGRIRADGVLTFANDAYCRLAGKTREDLLGKPWQMLAVPEDAAVVEAAQRALSPANPVVVAENRVYGGDGRIRWMQFVNRGLFDAEGRLVEIQGVGRDVTERKEAEQALARATEELENTFRHTPALLATLDLEGRFVRVNPAWGHALGYAPEELPGNGWLELFDQRGRDSAAGWLARLAQETHTPGFTARCRAKDGSWRHLDLRLFLAGGLVHVAGRDITETIRSEEELRESHQTLDAMFQSMAQGVVWQEADGRITAANPAAQHILGLSLDELTGRISMDPRWRAVREDGSDFPGEDHPAMTAIATGEGVSGVVMGVFNPQREQTRWISISAVPRFRPGEERPNGVYTVFDDITERRSAEETARRAARMESVATLAAGIAHEFNNHLTVILGTAELLRMKPNWMRPDIRDSLDAVSSAGRHCANLTQQLLAFAHGGRFEMRQVSLNDTVRGILNDMSGFLPDGVRIKSDLDASLQPVAGDSRQLRHVVDALVRNAAEACGPKDRIRVITCQRRWTEQDSAEFGLPPGEYAYLMVEDTGCGMDEATLARVFEPFFTTKFLGRGLGLAAVHGIVENHKGLIRVESTPGSGSTVHVLLPVAPAEAG
jgi:two-component system, cell cycle sensor histidine kinase and response regulator CckA